MKKDYRKLITEIRFKFLKGDITLEQAKDLVNPLLLEMNVKGKEIAKEFGMKHKPLTFGYIFR